MFSESFFTLVFCFHSSLFSQMSAVITEILLYLVSFSPPKSTINSFSYIQVSQL